jgi:hypothetical protein
MEVAMTPKALRHTLSAVATAALLSGFAGNPASTQGIWDHSTGPRGMLFTPNQGGQGSPAQSQTPSMSRPSSAKPILKNRNRQRSLSESGVQKGLSLTDDQ